jgi:5'-methylthioadenosine phosphorylase
VIGGSSILGAESAIEGERRAIGTGRGEVTLIDAGDWVVLQRHGIDEYRPAAAIDYRANLAALAEAGCDRILALGSTGGLRPELGVGTFLCPDDFIALHLGISMVSGHAGEQVPGFDPSWRGRLLEEWGRVGDLELRDGGVYWQTIGPRFETRAEIRLIAAHADVVGMTIASECVLAGELGIPYAAVCVVDNLANGVGTPLRVEDFEAGKAANRGRLLAALEVVMPALADDPG